MNKGVNIFNAYSKVLQKHFNSGNLDKCVISADSAHAQCRIGFRG